MNTNNKNLVWTGKGKDFGSDDVDSYCTYRLLDSCLEVSDGEGKWCESRYSNSQEHLGRIRALVFGEGFIETLEHKIQRLEAENLSLRKKIEEIVGKNLELSKTIKEICRRLQEFY